MNRHSYWASDPQAVRHSRHPPTSIHEIDPTPARGPSVTLPRLSVSARLLCLWLRPCPRPCPSRSLPLHVFTEQLVALFRRQVRIHSAGRAQEGREVTACYLRIRAAVWLQLP